jgi:hypothetical protein
LLASRDYGSWHGGGWRDSLGAEVVVTTLQDRSGLHPGVGWWIVLLWAVCWICSPPYIVDAPRPYASLVFVAARAGYAMVAARAAFAVLFRSRSWWWAAYAAVLFAVGPLVFFVVRSASDGWK